MAYFNDIKAGIRTTLKGLSLTFRHIRNATQRRTPQGIADATYFDQQNGLVTLQYPHEQLPIPDNGRYRLRNEIDDCIVCDKCAKICPVDCITIDAIKATEEVGRASDGSPIRLYAAKFDIDMAKCCYCGLCTVVCPTECLTMDKKFDYSEFELGKLTYEFATLTPEVADEKRSLYEQFLREKEEHKAAQAAAKAAAQPTIDSSDVASPAAKPRPAFRPTSKPAATTPPAEPANSEGSSIEHPLTDATPEEMQQIAQGGLETVKKPVFRPTKKPVVPTNVPVEARKDVLEQGSADVEKPVDDTPKPKAAPGGFRPTMKPPKPASSEPAGQPTDPDAPEVAKPKPAFRPTMKPPQLSTEEPAITSEPPLNSETSAPAATTRPAFRPTMKPKSALSAAESATESTADDAKEPQEAPVLEIPKPKPAFRPTMKPKTVSTSTPSPADESETNTDKKGNEIPVLAEVDPVVSGSPPSIEPKATQSATAVDSDKPEVRTDAVDSQTLAPPAVEVPTPKPVGGFRPTMKPKPVPVATEPAEPAMEPSTAEEAGESPETLIAEAPKPKPAFRPTMKPKVVPPNPPSDDELPSA
ncbi:4Fe-4S dicluster domain-containing protein [Spirosoma agri]|uniref:4Fe-4S dicluster domain-containing protein n=1 Tax=Spirosoma agri TaxID=1987381 RepID=A0A6M0IL48_9BACT|nr:4Fe-4S dicluster domain-containing protein [Spirosoma agri]NEU68874.1 4Fe-4S dicluster domain-containing protein [Spirosoma agri]